MDYKQKTLEFLKSHPLAVLSTISSDGSVDAAVIYAIVTDDLHFFFITKPDTKKAKNIVSNPQAALTIADQSLQTTVQVKGTIHDMQQATNYTQLFLNVAESISSLGTPPLSKLKSSTEYVLYKFTTQWMRYADFRDKS